MASPVRLTIACPAACTSSQPASRIAYICKSSIPLRRSNARRPGPPVAKQRARQAVAASPKGSTGAWWQPFDATWLRQQTVVMAAASGLLGPLCDGQHSSHDVLHYVAPSHLNLGLLQLETCWWVPILFALAGIIIGVGTPVLDAWQLDQGGDAPRGGSNPSWPFVLSVIALFVLQYATSGALEQPLLGATLPGSLPALDCLLAATGIALWAVFDGTRQGLFMAGLTAVCGPAVEITLINVFHLYAYTHPQWLGVPLWIPWVYFAGSPAVGNLARRTSSMLLSQRR